MWVTSLQVAGTICAHKNTRLVYNQHRRYITQQWPPEARRRLHAIGGVIINVSNPALKSAGVAASPEQSRGDRRGQPGVVSAGPTSRPGSHYLAPFFRRFPPVPPFFLIPPSVVALARLLSYFLYVLAAFLPSGCDHRQHRENTAPAQVVAN